MADTPDPADVEISHQPTLPELELPEYHGRKPSGMKTSLSGAGNRLSRAHEIEDRVVLVIEAKVKGAGHESVDDALVYAEKLKVLDLFEIQGTPGKRLLSSVRQAYRLADDQTKGRSALGDGETDLGSAGVTDASGNVLTPAELAELRGDPVRSMLTPGTEPVVVVYSDGAREIWPEEFEKDAPRPSAGDRFELEGAEGPVAYVYVEELLDAGSGERLAHWTKEQEEARLLALEEKAIAEEADAPPKGNAAYYRHERADGSVDENEIRAANSGDARVVAVFEDGAEEVLFLAETADSEFGEGFEKEPLDPSAPALPGEEGYAEGLEPLERTDFPEDDQGFADPALLPEPTDDDYRLVDRPIEELPPMLAQVDADLPRLNRLLEAEKRGRGRKLKTRKGAVDAILARIAEVEKSSGDA